MLVLADDGRLPEGVHETSLDDIKVLFGVFNVTDRRPRLFDKLSELVDAAAKVAFVRFLIVNGSFVTSKPDPGDIDIIVAVDPDFVRHATSARDHSFLSSRALRRNFPFDFFVAPAESTSYREYLDLFFKVKGIPGARKGVVKLRIHDSN